MYQADNIKTSNMSDVAWHVRHLLMKQLIQARRYFSVDWKLDQLVVYHPSLSDFIFNIPSYAQKVVDDSCNPKSVYLLTRSATREYVDEDTLEMKRDVELLIYTETAPMQSKMEGNMITFTQPFRVINRRPEIQFRIDIID